MIIPYEFYPANFGGALRCFHLLKELAKRNEVTLLTVQSCNFKNKSNNDFPTNVTIETTKDKPEYKTLFNIFPLRIARAINSRMLQRSVFEKGNLYLLKTYPLLKQLFLANNIDVVVYENLECFCFLNKRIKKLSPRTKHIYDAHNVDSALWKTQTQQKPLLLTYSKGALKQEKNLYKKADICFCCSENDKKIFEELNKKRLNIFVIPNGVDTVAKKFDDNPDKFNINNILFCGTLDYAPNKEGLLWFCDKIFPIVQQKITQIKLTIIGKMNNNDPYFQLQNNLAIDFIGPVNDVAEYYIKSSIAIVPLLRGSGTRLKILEAMSFGNPVVSTSIGAEGLQAMHNQNIFLEDTSQDFANRIVELIGNKSLFDKIRCNARELVTKEYDWSASGKKMNDAINSLLQN